MSVAGKILIANDLLTGETLFMGSAEWVSDHRLAHVAQTEDEASSLDALGRTAMQMNKVVDAYLIEVAPDETGTQQPVHYRERMRTTGPSNRPDLGKQAHGVATLHPVTTGLDSVGNGART